LTRFLLEEFIERLRMLKTLLKATSATDRVLVVRVAFSIQFKMYMLQHGKN
jgi:hypothetical protein